MNYLIIAYFSGVTLLSFLCFVAARTGHQIRGWASFVLLWPLALPYTMALLFHTDKHK